jgi:hypothetical protein
MEQPDLHNRHRDHNGEIAKWHGHTLIGTLRKLYGQCFAPDASDQDKLSHVLHKLDDRSLNELVHDHQGGYLDQKLKERV